MMPPRDQEPSLRQVVWATLGALGTATVILFVAVLPYEYGIDPLHTGRHLGLLRGQVAEPNRAPTSLDAGMRPVLMGPLARFGSPYRTDRVVLELSPYQYVEYKYHLAQGAGMVFSWQASGAVIYDQHGAQDGAPPGGTEPSLDKGTRTYASGSLVAPFSGMHGWYWENPGGTPLTITLASAGFYTSAIEYRSNRTTLAHELVSALAPSEPR